MWFSYKSDSRIAICIVLIPIPIPLGLIPILIPIWRFNKINDSDSNSGSSSKWFQFWFRFQCFPKDLIPILIPASFDFDSDSNKPMCNITPWTNQALILILIPESDSDSGIIYNICNIGYRYIGCIIFEIFMENG